MPLGAHMSIAGGIHQALFRGQGIGCETIQIFTKNSNRWQARPLTREDVRLFRAACEETGISPVLAHTSYLINLASPDEELWHKSTASFRVELERCAALDLPYLIFHPGAHTGAGEESGLERVARALNQIFQEVEAPGVTVLIETTAGQGSGLGYRFEHLARLIKDSDFPERLGVCFDTCHVFAAGYDLTTPEAFQKTIDEFHQVVGLDRLKAIHLNDSKGELGSRLDRHEHIGAGRIGVEGFRCLLNHPLLSRLPMVLETPKGTDLQEDVENLAILRRLIAE